MISTTNPVNEALLHTYKAHKISELYQIVSEADRAHQDWRMSDFTLRRQCFIHLAQLLRQDKETLARQITLEMGKPIQQSLAEIEKCAWVSEHYAEKGASYLNAYDITVPNKTSRVSYEPLGVILGIMPWNFPFWQVFRFVVPSLMAGNASIIKHAPITTGCGLLIVKLFQEAGFPAGLLSQVIIDESDCSELIMHPLVRAVSLTGSERAGRAVASLSGMHLKKTVLELGGNDAYIVLADANLEKAAQSIVASRMNNCGQVCIAAKRVIAEASILESLNQQIQTQLANFEMGDPLLPHTTLGPMARADLRQQLDAQIQKSIDLGAKCLMGGVVPEGCGYYYPATLLVNVAAGQPAFDEELFGPVIAMIEASDAMDAIKLANQSRYGLGAAIFSEDLLRAEQIASALHVGAVSINSMLESDPNLPFGGVKNSGYGRELGREGIWAFCNIKTVSTYV